MNISEFKTQLDNATAIVCFTGAGISTESGIPDFRSPNGIWSKYKPVYFQDFLASESDRERYWTMKKESFEQYKHVKPNTAHLFISQLNQKGKLLGTITQNIDGLHIMAGLPKEKCIEIHGTDREIQCLNCGFRVPSEDIFPTLKTPFTSPRCPDPTCEGLLKPATISFGQQLNPEILQASHTLCSQADLFITLGSSLVVYPAASLPEIAKSTNAILAIINREPTPLDHLADFLHHGEIGHFITQINSSDQ